MDYYIATYKERKIVVQRWRDKSFLMGYVIKKSEEEIDSPNTVKIDGIYIQYCPIPKSFKTKKREYAGTGI
tara:strand:+ start:1020 stop:1232 length:213 start_codon:yes stop_codon:yes gene_type:complete